MKKKSRQEHKRSVILIIRHMFVYGTALISHNTGAPSRAKLFGSATDAKYKSSEGFMIRAIGGISMSVRDAKYKSSEGFIIRAIGPISL